MADPKNNNLTGGGEKTPVEQYDSKHGKYSSNVKYTGSNTEDLHIAAALPKAADPSPFKLGNSGK